MKTSDSQSDGPDAISKQLNVFADNLQSAIEQLNSLTARIRDTAESIVSKTPEEIAEEMNRIADDASNETGYLKNYGKVILPKDETGE